MWITSISHTNEAEACPFWVLLQLNDANGDSFVHFLCSVADGFRNPCPPPFGKFPLEPISICQPSGAFAAVTAVEASRLDRL